MNNFIIPVQEVATKGPSRTYAFSQAPEIREVGDIQPQTAFLDQNDIFNFTQPAVVSGVAFSCSLRSARAQEATSESHSSASRMSQTSFAREVARLSKLGRLWLRQDR